MEILPEWMLQYWQMSLQPERVGIISKPHEAALPFIRAAVDVCTEEGIPTVLGLEAARLMNLPDGMEREEVVAGSDLIVVIGGDGTFLSIASAAVRHQVPIAGFNMGTLGFLTELVTDSIKLSMKKLLRGEMPVSERKVLRVELEGRDFLALNDVVASKGNIARVISLELQVNREPIARFRADGLIISTPTGSTAYSLSAGGPIVNPEVNALVVTPICAHSLTLRPLVVPDGLILTVARMDGDNPVFVTIDGQHMQPLDAGREFSVRVDKRRLKMIESPKMNYFHLLAEKLNWGYHKSH